MHINKSQLSINPWNLLNHPFYEAWNAGKLPLKALKTYAEEYGAFIAFMPDGWKTLGDDETVAEENEHIDLWADFAEGLDTSVSNASIEEVKNLTITTGELFSSPVPAIGAMYAFEVQQPETAKTKLSGLKEFYALPESCETYFETHAHNEHEAAKLLAHYDNLSNSEQKIANAACSQMSEAMWDALSGIYEQECADL